MDPSSIQHPVSRLIDGKGGLKSFVWKQICADLLQLHVGQNITYKYDGGFNLLISLGVCCYMALIECQLEGEQSGFSTTKISSVIKITQ